ncbi:MAG TPA: hypothetical protein P5055_04765, partial [Candidatus Paceibacterota bacterium]|nr:hypothetical protein [Candidatus Paceibacterota bacterium]
MNTMYSGSMSEDEVAILVISSLLGVGLWLRWLWLLLGVARFAREFRPRRPLALAPFLCALALFVVLRVYAAADVRLDPRYLGFYLVMGMTWLALTG